MAAGLTRDGGVAGPVGRAAGAPDPDDPLDSALRRLEFDRVLDRVARRAGSEAGARRVRALRPLTEPRAVEEALRFTDEMVGFLLRDEGWAPPRIPEVEAALRRLAVPGSVLTAAELGDAGTLLASSRRARGEVRRDPERFPRLAELGGGLPRAPREEERLLRSFDASGALADGASPTLRRVRRALRDARAALVERLERYARSLPARLQVADASVTVRQGRYCIPVRREGKGEVGGIVHDESASQRTVFVEPPLAIQPMNRIRELELEEGREEGRILRELTDLLRPLAAELLDGFDRLARLDAAWARARYALEHGGARPEVVTPAPGGPAAELRLVGAAHPLLLAAGEPTVPFDLVLGPEETVLLISGPNAGGKTVTLKTVGLVCAMAQSGLIPPLGAGSRLPLFRRVFAVIGDEQSIEASLSTFSAQLAHLREILEEADAGSLALVDEIGGNTDPAEGAALAAAALRRLAGQARLTLATSHLGDLKGLAAEDPRIVNASMQFDTAALRPTFRLVRDRPGRSYALEIAERLGLPAEVVEEARSRLSGAARDVDVVLAGLERREAELAELSGSARALRRALETRVAEAAERGRELDERAAALVRKEREAEGAARERTQRYLLEARREVEREVQRLREAAGSSGSGSPAATEEAVGAARASVERLLRESRARPADEEAGIGPAPALAEGDAVEAPGLGVRGRVRELRGAEAVVEVGGVRVTLPASSLRPSADEGAPGPRPVYAGAADLPDLSPRPEVDLRGLRVEEVEAALLPALDAAIAADLPTLRIVHGKGTGAVRDCVRRVLRRDGRVTRFRPGAFEEGGSGVTVVEFGGTVTGA